MAEPARKYPDPAAQDPRTVDPLNPIPLRDPADARFQAANQDPRVDNRKIVETQTRGAGSGVIIAAIALVLAVVAYFMFAPGSETPAPAEPPAAAAPEAPATPAAPAPDATAPAAPATPATPAPDASAPAAPATPEAPAAPEATQPAQPAPAAPAN